MNPGNRALVEEAVRAEGLELFAVASVPGPGDPAIADAERDFRLWIEAGCHGGMTWLERDTSARFDPRRLLEGCASLIVVGMNYYQPAPDPPDRPAGRVARYAWGRDYHNAVGSRLRRVVRELRLHCPNESFRPFVDACPLSERLFAARAGIGFIARNALAVSVAYGSWFVIGEILTTLRLPPTAGGGQAPGSCPDGCFRCASACPTGALSEPGRIDANRCIAYLTVEHRGSIPVELRPMVGDRVFGCDACQEVCPFNAAAQPTVTRDFTRHRAGCFVGLDRLLSIRDEEDLRARFEGSPLRRASREMLVRNACVAAGNAGSRRLLARLRRLSADQSAVVREHSSWAVSRLEAG